MYKHDDVSIFIVGKWRIYTVLLGSEKSSGLKYQEEILNVNIVRWDEPQGLTIYIYILSSSGKKAILMYQVVLVFIFYYCQLLIFSSL